MRDDLFRDRVAALGIPIDQAISETMPREALDGRDEMPLLFVEEGNPVGDQDSLPRIATRTPGTGPRSVRVAREFALATLQRWGVAERSEDIAIVISELLTNALRHALPEPGHTRPIRLGLLQPGPCLLCAVTDPSRAAPIPQAPREFLSETGRGLQIICALSDRWGYTPLSDAGKVVWATFT